MRRSLLLALLALAGCADSRPGGPAATTPAATATEPGATGPVAPATTAARGDDAARVLRIVVGNDSIDFDAGTEWSLPIVAGNVDAAAMKAALNGVHADGGATVQVADDGNYQGLVTAMDVVNQLGYALIGIETPADPSDGVDKPPVNAESDVDLKEVPIVIVTPSDVWLSVRTGKSTVRPVFVGAVADILAQPAGDIPALRSAIDALANRPSTIVFQADRSTPGALINRAVRTLRLAGVSQQLFAIKTTP